jgi:hypothetical protein
MLGSNSKHFYPIKLGNLRISCQNPIQIRVIRWQNSVFFIVLSNVSTTNLHTTFYIVDLRSNKWNVVCQIASNSYFRGVL